MKGQTLHIQGNRIGKKLQLFIAEVPELPGCMADGHSYQEAVSNAETIINEWIETAKDLGRTIPKPKGKLNMETFCSVLSQTIP